MKNPIIADNKPHAVALKKGRKYFFCNLGHHGPMAAMGVPRNQLPKWDDIQIMVAQLHRKPLPEDAAVGTNLVIGPEAKKPLELKIPLFVSDMSFGSLSEEAKIALAMGAEMVGTGICSGEGGMLPEDFAKFADRVRTISGGIPVGFKMSANQIEQDLEFALQAGAD